MKINTLIFIVFFCLTTTTGCSPFKPVSRASIEKDLPEKFSLYAGESKTDTQWWQSFGSAELNHLIDTGLAGNLPLKETWARLNQSRARAAKVGADRYPDLTGTVGAGINRSKSGSGASVGTQTYSLGLASSY